MDRVLSSGETGLIYVSKFDEYGVLISDGGTSYIIILFCPWCGSKFPESKRDKWFDTLETLGIDPLGELIPEEFLTNRWYSTSVWIRSTVPCRQAYHKQQNLGNVMDWSAYEDVWIDPERVSGAPCLRGTRLPVEAVITNFDSYIEEGFSPETVAMIVSDLFPSATPERVLKLMAFVAQAERLEAA